MSATILVDSNVILYTLDHRDAAKRAACKAWLRAVIQSGSITISPQVCTEVRNAGVRKLKLPIEEMRTVVRNLLPFCNAPLGAAELTHALELEARWKTSWLDSVLMASALSASCTHFLTENAQSAPVIEGLRIIDPFAVAPEDVLGAA